MPARRRMDARTVDEVECIASVLLSIAAAHLLRTPHVSWAAFTGYMVMRGHVGDTFTRGVLRLLGTAVGAGMAILAVPVVAGPLAMAAALALVGTGSLYGALTTRRSYAWLFLGLTFAMVLLDVLERPSLSVAALARERMLATVAGTLVCVAVSTVSALTLRRLWPAVRVPPAASVGFDPHALRHAAQGGVALALLPPIASLLDLRAAAPAAITIMAVMLVPLPALADSGFDAVTRRIAQRLVGCLAGAALAGGVLLVAGAHLPLLLVGVAIGVAIGRHLENGAWTHRYVGTQFVLALLVVLVPDLGAAGTIAPALARLSGIVVGLALLEPVLLGWHLLAPARPWRRGGRPADGGSIDA